MRYEQENQNRYQYAVPGQHAGVAQDTREKFIARVYNHLFLAIAAFTALEIAIFKLGYAERIAQAVWSVGPWAVVLGFIGVSWGATWVAHRAESKAAQYAALSAFVVMEAIFFIPVLMRALAYAPGAIQSAGIVTLVGFGGLTGIVLWTRKDFSFLGAFIRWGIFAVLGLVIASLVFSFTLGTLFSVAMVAFAGAIILYQTSSVIRDYPEDRYVAASLDLFASVAMMFLYVLRLFSDRR